MKIETLHYSDEKGVFVVSDVIPGYLNTIRRLIIESVPTMAIDKIRFVENNSALYDEMLALRLGLVPLVTDLKTYELKEKCKCKNNGCAMCELKLHLEKEGPCTVYSGDLKSDDPKVKPAIDDIPLVKLLKNQKVKFEAVAVMGIGKMHAKFIPGLIYYMGYPTIKVNNQKIAQKFFEEIPKELAELSGNKIKIKDYANAEKVIAMLDSCPEKVFEIEYSEDKFIVFAESWGQLNVRDMLKKAVDVFNEQLEEFAQEVKKMK